MEKDFALGLALGMIGGALIIANSYQARKFVKDGQEQIKEKASAICKKKKKQQEYESDDED